jgi:hypothetical protein
MSILKMEAVRSYQTALRHIPRTLEISHEGKVVSDQVKIIIKIKSLRFEQHIFINKH